MQKSTLSRPTRARVTMFSGVEMLCQILETGDMVKICEYSDEFKKLTILDLEEIVAKVSMSRDEVFNILSKLNPDKFIFDVSTLDTKGTMCKKVTVLYDASSSMLVSTYNDFHKKMGNIFLQLEAQGVEVCIFYFSSSHVSSRGPISVDMFCRGTIPGGSTSLAPAWNQMTDGMVLLITDGQFHDNIGSFRTLSIDSLILACPSWAGISTQVIQQLRDKLGNIPLDYKPVFDQLDLKETVQQLLQGSCVADIPPGFRRFGTIIFPECWTSPSTIANVINYLIKYQSDSIVSILTKLQEMFLSINRTMRVDFEGTLMSEESRALLTIVNTLKQIADVQMDSAIKDKGIADSWNSIYHVIKDLIDYGSLQKSKMGKEVSRVWDECFSADESIQILGSCETQTHTLVFPHQCPYEILKTLRVSGHALDITTMICLQSLFKTATLYTGVREGINCYPVFYGDLKNTIRLLPCDTFRESGGVSFTYQSTVTYRLMCWLVADMIGPNGFGYQTELKMMMSRSLSNIPDIILTSITEVDIDKQSADKNKSISWLRCILQISQFSKILKLSPEKIDEINELYLMMMVHMSS